MIKKIASEFLATFFLVFAGTGAIVINQESNGTISHVGVAITFGLVVTAMIFTFSRYSGSHMNPAVTIACAIGGKFNLKEMPAYILAQIAGALSASLLLRFLFPANEFLGATIPVGSEIQSFILEFIMTFFLMFVVLATTIKENSYAPFVIGFVVLLEAMFGGPISGASMNPARSFGPAIVSGHMEHLWVYIAATILGSCIAMLTFKLFEK